MQKQNSTPNKKTAKFADQNQIFTYTQQIQSNSEENVSLLIQEFSGRQISKQNQQQKKIIEDIQMSKWSQQLAQINLYINNDIFLDVDDLSKNKKIQGRVCEKEQQLKKRSICEKIECQSLNVNNQESNTNKDQENLNGIKQIINVEKEKQDLNSLDIQKKINQEKKKPKRVTMSTQQILKIINENNEEKDKRQQQKIKQKNRITMDVFAITKMINQQQKQEKQENNQQNRINTDKKLQIPENQNKYPQLFSIKKQKQNELIKLQVMKYEQQIIKRAQIKRNQIIQLRKSISRYEGENQICIKRKQIQGRNIQKLKIQLQRMNFQIQEKQKQLQFLFNQEEQFKLQQLESYYCMKIIQYKQIPQKGLVFLYATIRNLKLKVKKQHKKYSQLRLLAFEKQEYMDFQILFKMQVIIKILKQFHHQYLRTYQNLFYTVTRINSYYLNLLNLSEDIEHLSQVFQFSHYQLLQSMKTFSFRFNFAGKVNLQIYLNLNQLLDDYSHIQEIPLIIYNLNNKQYVDINIQQVYQQIKDKQTSFLSIAIDRLCQIFIK